MITDYISYNQVTSFNFVMPYFCDTLFFVYYHRNTERKSIADK